MNGSHISRCVAALVVAVIGWSSLHSQLLAEAPRKSSTTETHEMAATTKSSTATRTISGRVFDAHGKPLSGAIAWLIRQDDSNLTLPEPTVIAEARSRADGHFELTPLVAELNKHADDPIAEFDVWVWKRGFAVGHWGFYGETIPQPIHMLLAADNPFELLLKTPDGTPCQGATITPIAANFSYARAIPKPLRDRLQVRSAAGGRAEIPGFDGRFMGVKIEKPGLDAQTLLLTDQALPPLVATLHETRSLEGRFVFPKDERVDASKAIVLLDIATEKTIRCKNQAKNVGEPPAFGFWQEFSPKVDRDGRFRISGSLDHGGAEFHVKGFPDTPWLFALPIPSEKPTPDPQDGSEKFEIHLIKGIWCNVLIRDAQTKKPLAGVDFAIGAKRLVDGNNECGEWIDLPDSDRTDRQGRIRIRVRRGETYRARCVPCEGYLDWSANESAVHIPLGVDHFDLPPIELTRACTIRGRLIDGNGKPVYGVSIVGAWSPDARLGEKATSKVAHRTVTDSAGHFQFEDVAAGTDVTLLPARGGVPIGDPLKTVAGADKTLVLKTRNEELVTLTGRLLTLDRKPIANAQLFIEVESAAPTFVAVHTGPDGTFRTPKRFPRRLRYRLAARLLLDVIGSSDWICPGASGTSFPDLSVDAAKLRFETRLSGSEVVARVNGEPVRSSEILERA